MVEHVRLGGAAAGIGKTYAWEKLVVVAASVWMEFACDSGSAKASLVPTVAKLEWVV